MGSLSSSGAPAVPVSPSSAFDAFGDILQPQKPGGGPAPAAPSTGMGAAPPVPPPPAAAGPIITGDLDSSLASLAQNLDMNGPKGNFKK